MNVAICCLGLLALLVSGSARVTSKVKCTDVIRLASSFTGKCYNAWSEIKPSLRQTQHDLGFAWVQRKLDDDFGSESDAQDEINDKSPIPAVLGPNSSIFITDSHHTLAALDFSGFGAVNVQFNIVCDWRNINNDTAAFWTKLSENNMAWLPTRPAGSPDALPTSSDPRSMPTYFSFEKSGKSSFVNNNWRSLAGFSRKHKDSAACKGGYKYCMRCFVRTCADDGSSFHFIEFYWGYFFNAAYIDGLSGDAFAGAYRALGTPVMEAIDVSAWMEAADALIALCRSPVAANFTMPASLFPEASLPGLSMANEKLPKDPSCDAGECPS